MNLNNLRLSIDRIDKKIIRLIAQRLKLAKKAGVLKKESGREIADGKREEEIFKNVKKKASELGINPDMLEKIWKILIMEARKCQIK